MASVKLTKAAYEKECKECHKVIKKGELHHLRHFDYTIYCKDCYERKSSDYCRRMEESKKKYEALVEMLCNNSYSAKELHDKFGGNYSTMLKKLRRDGYPIARYRNSNNVVFSIEKENGDCAICGESFTFVPMVGCIPHFLCDQCIDDIESDRPSLIEHMMEDFDIKDTELTFDQLCFIEAIRAITRRYIPPDMSVEQLIDKPVLEAMLDPESHFYCEEPEDASCYPPYAPGFFNFSGSTLIHLAAEAKKNGFMQDQEIAVLLCLGLRRLRPGDLTRSQIQGEERIIKRVLETGLLNESCDNGRCSICSKAWISIRGSDV